MRHEWFVYIVECSDGSYYSGFTNSIERRMREHNDDDVDKRHYTATRQPVALVYVKGFREVWDAIAWEKRIKRWSRRKKKALIAQEFESLPALAVCTNGTHFKYFKAIACRAERSRSATSALLCLPRLRSG
jgi:putative endonuclease